MRSIAFLTRSHDNAMLAPLKTALLFAAAVMLQVSVGACQPTSPPSDGGDGQPLADPVPAGMEVATFAGGCFWCMEGPFESIDGVEETLSGYTGGPEANPTYYEVSRGQTGHTEAVRVVYDPDQVTYEQLLDAYWRAFDPTDADGQFADRGSQYRPGIFVHSDEQRAAALASKEALEADGPFDEPIVVPVEDAGAFYVAEEYHQDYYLKNPTHYRAYRRGSGREGFLARHWGDAH